MKFFDEHPCPKKFGVFPWNSIFYPYKVSKMSTCSLHKGLTWDGLVSRAEGANDSHSLNTAETEDKHRLHGLVTLVNDLA